MQNGSYEITVGEEKTTERALTVFSATLPVSANLSRVQRKAQNIAQTSHSGINKNAFRYNIITKVPNYGE
jgi:hypothetical protein